MKLFRLCLSSNCNYVKKSMDVSLSYGMEGCTFYIHKWSLGDQENMEIFHKEKPVCLRFSSSVTPS